MTLWVFNENRLLSANNKYENRLLSENNNYPKPSNKPSNKPKSLLSAAAAAQVPSATAAQFWCRRRPVAVATPIHSSQLISLESPLHTVQRRVIRRVCWCQRRGPTPFPRSAIVRQCAVLFNRFTLLSKPRPLGLHLEQPEHRHHPRNLKNLHFSGLGCFRERRLLCVGLERPFWSRSLTRDFSFGFRLGLSVFQESFSHEGRKSGKFRLEQTVGCGSA